MLQRIILGVMAGLCVQAVSAEGVRSFLPSALLEESDLLANMPLFDALLLQKIAADAPDDVATLLALYETAAGHDPLLVAYAQAFLAKKNSDYQSAIKNYREILQVMPNDVTVRHQLASSLAADKQYKNAQAEIAQIQSVGGLSEEEYRFLEASDAWLKQQSNWDSNFGVAFLNNNNVNQAPTRTEYRNWQLDAAKRAYGAQLNWSASQSHNIANHWFRRTNIGANAKLYNRHDFDDIYAQAGIGIAKQDAKSATGADVQYQKRWYATKPYSDRVGVEVWHQRPIFSKYYLHAWAAVNQLYHQDRKFLDGVGASAGLTLQQSNGWISAQHDRQAAKDSSEAHYGSAVYFGTQKQWGKIGSAHSVGVEYKKYRAEDVFNIRRRDWRYRVANSIWHDDVAVLGFVPSLTVEFVRNDSNHFAFDTKDSDVYFQLRKKF